ncbi:PAS domain-containing protein [Curvivirga aplysinae]|uniref:PAS domain-containing protein n=1 Tax=Curvivirga aplysinae TaxID=2529852 RepID=UPI001C3FC4D2|nr:PAS domain-containing protein [Curvivirga aplysinae]
MAVEELKSQRHRSLYQLWLKWKEDKYVPHKSQINPLEIGAETLPYLAILEVVNDGVDYLYRLVGTALVHAIDKDFTGETIVNFFGRHDELSVLEGYEQARKSQLPLVDTGDFRDKSREFISYQRLILPFELDDEVRIFLACFDFDRVDFPSFIGH